MTAAVEGRKPLGFWSCWALVVGTMIGSGVFTMPAVLAPYGLLSFGGWLVSAGGAILLALVFARLAAKVAGSGGPYIYAREAFGPLAGFLIGWSCYVSYLVAIPAIAIAFAGYLPALSPAFAGKAAQAGAALALTWALALVNLRSLKSAGMAQIATAVLKIAPLLAVGALGVVAGDGRNLPPVNPGGAPVLATIATTALLSLWAFTGFEAGVVGADSVRDAERTAPRALMVGMLTVAAIYLLATLGVMRLVPASALAGSTAPFAEAARGLGPWGPAVVAIGALVSTAGAANGCYFICGQLPQAAARDGLAPPLFARVNGGGAPSSAILLTAVLATLLLAANYSRTTLGAFTFLVVMSTLSVLVAYFVCALADVKRLRRVSAASMSAAVGAAYALFAIWGAGAEALLWGGVLLAAGAPLYVVAKASGKGRIRISDGVR